MPVLLWAELLVVVLLVVVLLLVQAPGKVVRVGVLELAPPLQLAVRRAAGSWNKLDKLAAGCPRAAGREEVEEAGARLDARLLQLVRCGRVPAAAAVGARVVRGGRAASAVLKAPRVPTGLICPVLVVLTA